MANLQSIKINGVNLFDIIFPIGSVVISKSSTNPSELYGGVWKQITGKTIIGVDPEDTDFSKVGSTGGEKEHVLTVSEMPSHSHAIESVSTANYFVDQGSYYGLKSREVRNTDPKGGTRSQQLTSIHYLLHLGKNFLDYYIHSLLLGREVCYNG